MYDVNHNFAPANISNIFTKVKDIHNYNTRSSSRKNYFINYARLNTLKNSFSHVGVRLWNQIPAHIRNAPKKAFNKAIKSGLLDNLHANGY